MSQPILSNRTRRLIGGRTPSYLARVYRVRLIATYYGSIIRQEIRRRGEIPANFYEMAGNAVFHDENYRQLYDDARELFHEAHRLEQVS
jgi:hypothetical protein